MKAYARSYHETPKTMVIESLDESIFAVKLLLSHFKTSEEFTPFRRGVLGYPATILMFSIIDTLGYLLIGELVSIDGLNKQIDKKNTFRVLNSKFFGLDLTSVVIDKLYNYCRNQLTHNATLPKHFTLSLSDSVTFIQTTDLTEKGKYVIHLLGMEKACLKAIYILKNDERGKSVLNDSKKTKKFIC